MLNSANLIARDDNRNLNMTDKRVINLSNPIDDPDAMNLGYFTNLFKTKYTGTIASGVFQRTNPTNNFRIPVAGNTYFNMYSVVLTSNTQVSNAQILINGKLQGQSSNTDTYHRLGNIIVGSNTFNMPKSVKFISIDSISILNNIGAGTAVNGSFELKVLYSDFFVRRHKEMKKEVVADATQRFLTIDMAYFQDTKELKNERTQRNFVSNSFRFKVLRLELNFTSKLNMATQLYIHLSGGPLNSLMFRVQRKVVIQTNKIFEPGTLIIKIRSRKRGAPFDWEINRAYYGQMFVELL